MSTEATQNSGADVLDLEAMFAADDAGNGATDAAQNNEVTGNAGQAEVELDDQGNPLPGNPSPDDELDLGTEIEVDPNAEGEPVELVVPDDHKVTLTIDGKEVDYTFGDLKAGAQKYDAANKRFEEAAAIRKEYTEKAQGLGQREQQLGQVLNHYIQQSEQIMRETQPNWEKLIAEDPQQYLVARHNWELKQRQVNEARQVQANLQAQQQATHAASANQRAIQARDDLIKAIPEFSDPQKLAAGARQIDQYLSDAGISGDMRSAIDSAEVLVIARKAMLYDQAIAKQKAARVAGGTRTQAQQAQPQVQQRRNTGRVERPGAATATPTAATRNNVARANATKAFNANPTVDTLASFFE